MDPILQVLLSWQFVFFGLAVATVIYVFRLVVEYLASVLKKDLATSQLWNNLVLPIAPIIIGVLAAIVLKKFPYPGFTPDANGIVLRGDRIIFGLVGGTFSTLMYRVVKSLFYQKMVNVAQGLTGNVNPCANVPTEQIPAEQIPSRGQL
jgi:hypothetical protein